MSFILDALRKSEHARERRALPGLVDLPVSHGTRSRLPWIVGGVGALLLVNLGVLIWVLARPSPPRAAALPVAPLATPAPAAAPAARSAPAAAAPARRAAPEVRPLAAETEAGEDPALDRAEPARPPAPARSGPPLVRAAPAAHGAPEQQYASERAAAVREFRGGSSVAGLPSIHELPAQVTAGLPQLNLELHVYSGDPTQRFVIINGQRLHEGAQLKEGLTVEQIVPEGAILNHQGTRFLLPRE